MTKEIPEILDKTKMPPAKKIRDMSAYLFAEEIHAPETKVKLNSSAKSMLTNFAVNASTVRHFCFLLDQTLS